MSAILPALNRTIMVERPAVTSGKSATGVPAKTSNTVVFASLPCAIRPAGGGANYLESGKAVIFFYKFICELVDVREGDIITLSDGRKMKIKSANAFTDYIPHTEFVAVGGVV